MQYGFTPLFHGLPLSLLDRNLVCGNSSIGIGTVDEIQKRFEETDHELFRVDAKSLLADATTRLRKLAKITDATCSDVERARKSHQRGTKSHSACFGADLIPAKVMAAEKQKITLTASVYLFWRESDPMR